MATTNTLKTASVLAFERKIDPSDALFAAGTWAQRGTSQTWPVVEVRAKSVRGTISNRLKTKDQDPTKLDAAIENPNLQTVDVSMLPADADTLKVSFTLRVLGGTGTPSACNSVDYQAKLLATVQTYSKTPGFGELARRYAHNLANGRFLWRNRLGAEQIEVQVAQLADGQAVQRWTFDALAHSLRDFETISAELTQLAALLEQGLGGSKYVLLQVTAYVRVGAGQEAFPSQELILDKDKAGKSKTLYKVNEVAAMHSQKIGNALRTIDTWYPIEDGVSQAMPIAVEPYGSVTSQGKAYRQPRVKMDFYSLLDAWVLKDQVPDVAQQHFVMANLVRGGVFGESGKD
jgi:CRISPR-associated protein Csy3